MEPITNDVTDSRDVVKRIDDLKIELEIALEGGSGASAEEVTSMQAELALLEDFAEEASEYAPDWHYGETIIHEDYFVAYAEQLADEIGAINKEAEWPLTHIDWEAAADELKIDYSVVGFNGIVYYIR